MDAFPGLSFKMGHLNIADDGVDLSGSLDSLSLGQLKGLASNQPKPKPQQYAMRYEDEDSVFDEIEEFFSYIEMRYISGNLNAWQASFQGEWSKTSSAEKKAQIEVLLESLEHRDSEIRWTNARKLLYVLQGVFAETTSPEHHLHMIIENCKIVRAANGVYDIVEALRVANSKHDLISSLTDADLQRLGITEAEKQESLDDINTEVSFYCGMLYFLVQIFKGDEEFADELMSLDPPLPISLFNMVSTIKDKSLRGYPVKKILLLLWKTMLACFGGMRELARAKKLARELAELPPAVDEVALVKSSPIDFKQFRQETSVKYPTFVPYQKSDPAIEKIATAIAPLTVKHHHHQANDEPPMSNMGPSGSREPPALPPQLPPTPVPSPPPNGGKPKKQLYQTDPNRPFLFPFSRTAGRGNAKLVPFAIDEADRLYMSHMHTSLSLFQLWQTREAYLLDENGLDPNSPQGLAALELKAAAAFGSSKFTKKNKASANHPSADTFEETMESPLADVQKLDHAISDAQKSLEGAERQGDRAAKRKAKERKDDLVRLRRVETLYAAVLPGLANWVLVLLRLLLASVSAAGGQTNQTAAPGTSPALPIPVTDPTAPPPTLHEIDINRHREITAKAVAGLLFLTLKWFKVSHVMKFHHLGAMLLESNILVLILKILGLQETSVAVTTKNDSPDNNFFRFCNLNFAKNAQQKRPEDMILSGPSCGSPSASKHAAPRQSEGEDEIEYLTDFSWRNFFCAITFVRIMQKMTKGRSHRITLLVNYKSSAILKRMLKVSHPMLQLHLLKLMKSQVPYCGKKWKQTNMKVITSIYLNCRPDLRDEWLTGNELEDPEEAIAQEQALRTLIKFYNGKRYGQAISTSAHPTHRRGSSISMPNPDPSLANVEIPHLNRPLASPHMEMDVFPPLRSRVADPSVFTPYIPEDIAFEEEYEDYLSDLIGDDPSRAEGPDPSLIGFRPLDGPTDLSSAWQRIEDFAGNIADGISDSESIVSIGEIGDEGRNGLGAPDSEAIDENLNNWEHMSPKTFKALPKSPASGGRRSSSGASLRPVLPFGLDDGSAVDEEFDELEQPELGPIPTGRTAPFAANEGGKGVDEVEYMYGE